MLEYDSQVEDGAVEDPHTNYGAYGQHNYSQGNGEHRSQYDGYYDEYGNYIYHGSEHLYSTPHRTIWTADPTPSVVAYMDSETVKRRNVLKANIDRWNHLVNDVKAQVRPVLTQY